MEMREFVIQNRHGKRMPATLRVAEGHPRGFAIVLHGLGGYRAQGVIVAAAEAACSAGYTALTFDAANGAVAPDADFFHTTNSGYLEDVADVVASLRKEHLLTGKFVLMGHSQGGLIALTYAGTHAADIERLVLLAPALAWYSGLWMYWPRALAWIVFGSIPWKGPNNTTLRLSRTWLFDFLKFDGYAHTCAVTAPTLLISAGQDETVGKPYIQRAFAKRFSSGQFACVGAARHAFKGYEADVADTIKQWLTSS